MTETVTRRSPLHDLLKARGASWQTVEGVAFAVRFRSDDEERRALESLAICDMSGLAKLGVKGPQSAEWLSGQGLDVPDAVFATSRLGTGGLLARLGADEFFLESGPGEELLAQLDARLAEQTGRLLRVEHQEATLLLTGTRCLDVLAQTCGFDFANQTSPQVVLTRVAGVSCGVFLDSSLRGAADVPVYRLWVDASYAHYLWETLVEICESLGGAVIGTTCFYPDWDEGTANGR